MEYKIMPWVILIIAFTLAMILVWFDSFLAITVFCMLTVFPILSGKIMRWMEAGMVKND